MIGLFFLLPLLLYKAMPIEKEDHHISRVLDSLFNTLEITTENATANPLKPSRKCKQAIKDGFTLAKPITANQLKKTVANATYQYSRSNIAIDKPKKSTGKPKDSIAVLDFLDLGLLIRYSDSVELSLRQVRTVNRSIHDAIIINLLIDIDLLAVDTLKAIQKDPDLSFYGATKIAVTRQLSEDHSDRVGNSTLNLQKMAVIYSTPINKLYKALVSSISHIMQNTADLKSVYAHPLTIDI